MADTVVQTFFNTVDDTVPQAALTVDGSDYASTLEEISPGITEKIDQVQMPGESWLDTLQRMLPTLATAYQQHQLLQVQVDRARQGLPPLNVSQYAAGVQVGLSDDTKRLIVGSVLGIGVLLAIALAARRRG